ncbi:hypothetical protein RJ639_027074 [Escallonia herrerae]|uniref:Gnk2-homologous domain-containing protein n=1 Tax=Escallonia herrerae TaxID=1293975 RepID=A0AA89BG78_9ASTE|nr:hypothetical protein RJ639_027074 [Escallonia herrerae]
MAPEYATHGQFSVSLTTPQQTLAYYRCSTDGNYTANSTYAANLKTLLSSISTTSDLFFNASIGQKEDQVYALAICRFTETVTSCRSCLNDSSQAITRACPHQKETFGGYDECRLRFSNRNILSSMEDGILYRRCNMNDAANISQFDDALAKLLLSLNDAAAAPQKYAAGEGNYTSLSKIYGMQQCTPDITEQECRQCLLTARNDMINNCYGKLGFISVAYSCQLQFELFQFFPLPADASPQPPRSMPAPPPPQFPPDTPGTLRANLFSCLHGFNMGIKTVN